jgi:hypothetical protein
MVLATFVIIIARIPKLQVGMPEPSLPEDVDWSFYPRLVFVSFVSIFGFFGVGAIGTYYFFQPVYAKAMK